jgi:hypothetical protein
MTTRSELKEIQSPHVDELDAGQVAESLDNAVILVVDHKRTAALTMSAVPELSFASTEFTRIGDLDNVGVRVEALEKSDGLLCLGERLGGVLDDERNFLDLLDAVATGEDQRGQGGGSESRDNGKAALVLVHLDMPFAPGLGGCEHTSTTAHVTEGSLKKTEDYGSNSQIISYTPGRNGEFLHHRHGEYERRHDQYPKTQH